MLTLTDQNLAKDAAVSPTGRDAVLRGVGLDALRHLSGLVILLGFTAGFVDTVGFVGLFGLFPAHVTGNLVILAATVTDPEFRRAARIIAVPAFVSLVVLARLIALFMRDEPTRCLRVFIGAQAVLLFIFMEGALVFPPAKAASLSAYALAFSGVAAMAIQNTGSRLVLRDWPATASMTNNVTQAIIDIIEVLLHASHGVREASRTRLKRTVPVLSGFVAGALGGALGFAEFGFWCLVAPILLLTAMFAGMSGRRPLVRLPPFTHRDGDGI